MDRPLCEHCGRRYAKRGRRFCSACYRAGVSQRPQSEKHERELCGLCLVARPADSRLADTGLRIHDELNALVHPDGRLEIPAPPDLVFRFFFEVDDEAPNVLRVLRVLRALPQGASHV